MARSDKRFELDSLPDDPEQEEKILRRHAIHEHRWRAAKMAFVAIGIAFMFVGLQRLFKTMIDHKELDFLHLEFVPPAVMLVCVAWCWARLFRYRYLWNIAVSNAGNLGKTTIMIDGFTNVFRIYAKTRRTGLHASFWVVWGIYSLAFYFIHLHHIRNEIYWPILITAGASVIVAFGYYLMTRSFLPGTTFIEYVISLNERAATAQQTNEVNSELVTRLLRPYRREKYWWFY